MPTTQEFIAKADKIKELGSKLSSIEKLIPRLSATGECVKAAKDTLKHDCGTLYSIELELSRFLIEGFTAYADTIKAEMMQVAASMAEPQAPISCVTLPDGIVVSRAPIDSQLRALIHDDRAVASGGSNTVRRPSEEAEI